MTATMNTNNADAFVFEFDGFECQIARAIEQLDWFSQFEQTETGRAIGKLKKLAKKFENADEDDFEEFVQKFFKVLKDWARDVATSHDELIHDINDTMSYCNFTVIEIMEGSDVSDNAKYIGKTFSTHNGPLKGIVVLTAYAYRCDYISDDVQDYFVARADVVVK